MADAACAGVSFQPCRGRSVEIAIKTPFKSIFNACYLELIYSTAFGIRHSAFGMAPAAPRIDDGKHRGIRSRAALVCDRTRFGNT